MYSPDVIVSTSTASADSFEVYAERVRQNMQQIIDRKNQAIRQEDFTSAMQTKSQLEALAAQLLKVELQNSTDLLTQVLSQWEWQLAQGLALQLSASGLQRPRSEAFMKQMADFPLGAPFHRTMLEILENLPISFVGAMIKSILAILPLETPEIQKSPFGFDAFVRKMPSGPHLNDQKTLEAVRCVVTLACLDLVCHLASKYDRLNITRDICRLVIRHAFFYFQIEASFAKKLPSNVARYYMYQIMNRWALIIGFLSASERSLLISLATETLDPAKRFSNEAILTTLQGLSYVQYVPDPEEKTLEVQSLMRTLYDAMEKLRKTSIRNALIQLMERVIIQFDFTRANANGMAPHMEESFRNEARDLYFRAQRWCANEEVRGSCLHLMVCILIRSPYEYADFAMKPFLMFRFYSSNIDELLAKEMLFGQIKDKRKSYIYDCLYQVVCGQFYHESLGNAFARLTNKAILSESWNFHTRADGEESLDLTMRRLNAMNEFLFENRKNLIPPESLHVCALLIAQIASKNLGLVVEKMLPHMFRNVGDEPSLVFAYLGVRAMKFILDPEYQFAEVALCRNDPNFPGYMNQMVEKYAETIMNLAQISDFHVGVSAMGKNIRVLDVHLFEDRVDDAVTSSIDSIWPRWDDESSALDFSRSPSLQRIPSHPLIPILVQQHVTSITLLDALNGQDAQLGLPVQEADKLTEWQEKTNEANERAMRVISNWFEICSIRKSARKLLEPAPIQKSLAPQQKRSMKMRYEQILALHIFSEVFQSIAFYPVPELHYGKYFIGFHLLNRNEEMAQHASFAIQRMFIEEPALRLKIINGFLNLLRAPDVQDSVSVCTLLSQLAHLIQLWVKEVETGGGEASDVFSPAVFDKVSCKLDAALLVCLARPMIRLRALCFQILKDFAFIEQYEKNNPPVESQPRPLTLFTIISRQEASISRHARRMFLQQYLNGHYGNTAIQPQMLLISFQQVLESEVPELSAFYLGEIAREFIQWSRPSAIGHVLRLLTDFAIPLMGQATHVFDTEAEYEATWLSLVILLFCFAGMSLDQNVEGRENTPSTQTALLFSQFRETLWPLIVSDSSWQTKSLFSAALFAHPGVIQLLLVNLKQWYSEERERLMKKKPNHREQIIKFIRFLVDNPYFDESLESTPSSMSQSIPEIIMYFLSDVERLFQDSQVPSLTSSFPLKTVLSYCSVLRRLALALVPWTIEPLSDPQNSAFEMVQMKWRRSPRPASVHAKWDVDARQRVFSFFETLGAIVAKTKANADKTPLVPSLTSFDVQEACRLLEINLNHAVEALLLVGDVFGKKSLPDALIQWFIQMECEGYHLFNSLLSCQLESSLDICLVQSYGRLDREAEVFFDVIVQHCVPRPTPQQVYASLMRRSKVSSNTSVILESYSCTIANWANKLDFCDAENYGLVIDQGSNEYVLRISGCFLFFGFYHLLHYSKHVRNRAFLLLEHLTRQLAGNSNEEETSYKCILFHSRNTSQMMKLATEWNIQCSQKFANVYVAFVGEAVRCLRVTERFLGRNRFLYPEQEWILDLLQPWMRNVSIQFSVVDPSKNEMLLYLLNLGFSYPNLFDRVLLLLQELVMNENENVAERHLDVLMELMIQVSVTCAKVFDKCLAVVMMLYQVDAKRTLDPLLSQLSYNKSQAPHLDSSLHQIAKDYSLALYERLYREPCPITTDDATVRTKTCILMLSQFIYYDYNSLQPYFPMILQQSILTISSPLSLHLLQSLIEGQLQAMNPMTSSKKLMILLQTPFQWIKDSIALGDEKKSDSNQDDVHAVWGVEMKNFLGLLFQCFGQSLIKEMAQICCRALDNDNPSTDHQSLMRAVECLSAYVTFDSLLSLPWERFHVRLYEKVTILLELENKLKIMNAQWQDLPVTLTHSLDASFKFIHALLYLQESAMKQYTNDDELTYYSDLFWWNVALLHLPLTATFKPLYKKALNNCRVFCALPQDLEAMLNDNQHAFYQAHERIRPYFKGLQVTLLQGLFDPDLEVVSLSALIHFWRILPKAIFNPAPTSFLYFILNALFWIYSRAYERVTSLATEAPCPDLISITEQLTEALEAKCARETAGIISSLKSLMQNQFIFQVDASCEQALRNVYQLFFPESATNIAEFLKFMIQWNQKKNTLFVLKCVDYFWQWDSAGQGKSIQVLRPILLTLPSLATDATQRLDLAELMGRVMTVTTAKRVSEASVMLQASSAAPLDVANNAKVPPAWCTEKAALVQGQVSVVALLMKCLVEQ